jgi:hypothetical protein
MNNALVLYFKELLKHYLCILKRYFSKKLIFEQLIIIKVDVI